MRLMGRAALALLAGVTAGLVLGVAPAGAQLDPGNFDIRQRGVVVGHIFVPERRNATVYVEHWVGSADYVHPSAKGEVATEIVASGRPFATKEAFFGEVPFGTGSRYIRVVAHDGDRLPDEVPAPAWGTRGVASPLAGHSVSAHRRGCGRGARLGAGPAGLPICL